MCLHEQTKGGIKKQASYFVFSVTNILNLTFMNAAEILYSSWSYNSEASCMV